MQPGHPRANPGDTLREFSRVVGLPVVVAVLATAGGPGWTTYHVKSGDTLSEIAQHFHVSVAKLVEVNDLPGNGDLIYAGETLRIPLPKAAPKKHSRPGRPAGTKTVLVRHKVVRGDTLSGLALHFHSSQAKITRANHLRSTTVYLGETLKIPVQTRVKSVKRVKHANTFAGRTYPNSVVRAAAHNRALLAERKLPDRGHTRALIVATAKAMKVDPALALAVAWQESGWNQRRVSVANAIGIMQVIPSTGRWMESVLDRDLDLLDARDNVLAGVGLLKVLTEAAPLRKAVAGYYQGLGSVRKNGMFPDTKRYVRNVLALREHYR